MSFLSKSLVLFFLLFTGLKVSLSAQSYTPPSPTASSSTQVKEPSVNMFKGSADISIPIYTAKDGDIKTEISLNYLGGNGIKVQDIAGPAGTGWNLKAGGVITRTIRNKPDEWGGNVHWNVVTNGGYINPDNQILGSKNGNNYGNGYYERLRNYHRGGAELEPDVFNSSIGGRIVFGWNGVPRFIEKKGYKIETNGLNSADSSWTIVDPKGTRYIFGKAARNSSGSNAIEYTSFDSDDIPPRFVKVAASWYLTEIISADGYSSITFSYDRIGKYESAYFQNQVATSTEEDFNGNFVGNKLLTNSSVFKGLDVLSAVYLKRIDTRNEGVTFDYIDRLDLPGAKAISNINIVTSSYGTPLLHFKFDQQYFKSAEGSPNSRLKLVGIEKYNGNYSKVIHLAKFTYNESVNLPSRGSEKFDRYGYYNNNQTGTSLLYHGANRKHDEARAAANILVRIDWETGGNTQYEYESNSIGTGGVEQMAAGVRVKRIIQAVGPGAPTLTTSFEYTQKESYYFLRSDPTGEAVSSGLLHTNDNPFDAAAYSTEFLYWDNIIMEFWRIKKEYDMPLSKLVDNAGISIGYKEVAKVLPDGSKEVYFFKGYDSAPDTETYEKFSINEDGNDYMFTYPIQASDRVDKSLALTSRELERGQLLEVWSIDANRKILQRRVNNYQVVYSEKIPGVLMQPVTAYYGPQYIYILHFFDEIVTSIINTRQYTQYFNPEKQQINSFGLQVQLTEMYRTDKYFTSHSAYPFLVTEEIEITSSGDELITTYKYPVDFVATTTEPFKSNINSLNTHNIFEPVEIVTKIKKGTDLLVTGATIKVFGLQYKWNNSQYAALSELKTLKVNKPINNYIPLSQSGTYDTRFETMLTTNNYVKGKPTQLISPGGKATALIRNGPSDLVLAEVQNALVQDALYMGFERQDVLSGRPVINTAKLLTGGTHTGSYYYSEFIGPERFMPLKPNMKYIFTYWYLQNGKWFFSGEIPYDDNICLTYVAPVNQGVDDLRLYPVGASMTTYNYDLNLGLTSTTDSRNKTTYYEYDDFFRLKNVKDDQGNIVTNTKYVLVNSGLWKDTNNKRCVLDGNGQYTGEEEMEQRDDNPESATYNQTKWRPLGYTGGCRQQVYVRIKYIHLANTDLGYWIGSSSSVPYGLLLPTYGSQENVNVVFEFFADQNFLSPLSVSNLVVNYKVKIGGVASERIYKTNSIVCNGMWKTLTNMPKSGLGSTFEYVLLPGPYYQ